MLFVAVAQVTARLAGEFTIDGLLVAGIRVIVVVWNCVLLRHCSLTGHVRIIFMLYVICRVVLNLHRDVFLGISGCRKANMVNRGVLLDGHVQNVHNRQWGGRPHRTLWSERLRRVHRVTMVKTLARAALLELGSDGGVCPCRGIQEKDVFLIRA